LFFFSRFFTRRFLPQRVDGIGFRGVLVWELISEFSGGEHDLDLSERLEGARVWVAVCFVGLKGAYMLIARLLGD
jgi:hypothetical protein